MLPSGTKRKTTATSRYTSPQHYHGARGASGQSPAAGGGKAPKRFTGTGGTGSGVEQQQQQQLQRPQYKQQKQKQLSSEPKRRRRTKLEMQAARSSSGASAKASARANIHVDVTDAAAQLSMQMAHCQAILLHLWAQLFPETITSLSADEQASIPLTMRTCTLVNPAGQCRCTRWTHLDVFSSGYWWGHRARSRCNLAAPSPSPPLSKLVSFGTDVYCILTHAQC